MFSRFSEKIEVALTRVILGVLGLLMVAIIMLIALFYLSWAIYLGAASVMSPALSALLVALVLLTILIAGFLGIRWAALRQHQRKHSPADSLPPEYAARQASARPFPPGYSEYEKMACFLLAGFLYSSSPQQRVDLLQLLMDFSRRP